MYNDCIHRFKYVNRYTFIYDIDEFLFFSSIYNSLKHKTLISQAMNDVVTHQNFTFVQLERFGSTTSVEYLPKKCKKRLNNFFERNGLLCKKTTPKSMYMILILIFYGFFLCYKTTKKS